MLPYGFFELNDSIGWKSRDNFPWLNLEISMTAGPHIFEHGENAIERLGCDKQRILCKMDDDFPFRNAGCGQVDSRESLGNLWN